MNYKSLVTCLAVLIFSVGTSFAQSERGTEVYFGYSNLQAQGLPDKNNLTGIFGSDFFNNRTTLQGFGTGVTYFPSETFGLTGDFSFNENSRSREFTNGRDAVETDIMYFMGGPTLSMSQFRRFQPFVRFLAGGAYTRFTVTSDRTLSTGNLVSSFRTSATDFALGMGGGLDLRVSDAVKFRLIQVDYTPIFLRDQSFNTLSQAGVIQPFTLNGQRMDNVRFTFGIVF
jgi:opacity protein-like surface antigen